jgi:uncharacterized phage protein (TIGR01671 family)
MREIKFRAKNNINGEFVYSNGYYFDDYNYWFLIPKENKAIAFANVVQIDINTLGEYTGLLDRSGKEIYIGDIVKLGDHDEPYEVIINDFMQIPVIDNNLGQENLYKIYRNCRVIGNIFDMPDWNF